MTSLNPLLFSTALLGIGYVLGSLTEQILDSQGCTGYNWPRIIAAIVFVVSGVAAIWTH